jgi:hypothetical protein
MTYSVTLKCVRSYSCVTGGHVENTVTVGRDGDMTQVVHLLLAHALCMTLCMAWGSIFEHLLSVLENYQCIF